MMIVARVAATVFKAVRMRCNSSGRSWAAHVASSTVLMCAGSMLVTDTHRDTGFGALKAAEVRLL